ncbi:hypothetical protein Drose_18070 [Dactylosporangium roseum]|uniref:Uncharacterized protein n=1 Tax=Dactylosporangium roseum TaxID=47989 RepID=A0ABY5ZD27_9ACTN|nr:hypothetical protein [Dactylosporangium roseum]UWZ39941.1 hypothetical protein Drose_18070 [Dactylosporangium roseum]
MDPHGDAVDAAIRELAEHNDPARGRVVPPPVISAAELRARADGLTPMAPAGTTRAAGGVPWWRRPGHPLRRRLPVVVWATVAAVALTAVAVVAAGRDDHDLPAPPVRAAPGLLPQLVTDTTDPAQTALDRLSATVARLPQRPAAGPDVCIHTQYWPSGPDTPSAPAAGDTFVAVDDRLCWTPQRTAVRRSTLLPPQPAGQVRVMSTGAPTTGATGAAHRSYAPGQLAWLNEVPSADQAVLAAQLSTYRSDRSGPDVTLEAVAEMYRYHVLNPAQRAAVLRVLANTPGLVYRGPVVDRAGRDGVAFSADRDDSAGRTRDVAVIDEDTGQLLSYERIAVLSHDGAGTRAPTLISYVLYLAEDWTADVD